MRKSILKKTRQSAHNGGLAGHVFVIDFFSFLLFFLFLLFLVNVTSLRIRVRDSVE